jgi:hypothetical protein
VHDQPLIHRLTTGSEHVVFRKHRYSTNPQNEYASLSEPRRDRFIRLRENNRLPCIYKAFPVTLRPLASLSQSIASYRITRILRFLTKDARPL